MYGQEKRLLPTEGDQEQKSTGEFPGGGKGPQQFGRGGNSLEKGTLVLAVYERTSFIHQER